MAMPPLKDRIQEILDQTGMSKADLSRAAGVTEAAVTFWLNGATRSIKGDTASKIEGKTGYRAAWVASGRLPKLVAPSEEGDMLLPQEVELITALRLLTEEEQKAHTKAIMDAARHNREVVEQHLRRITKADQATQARRPPRARRP